MSSPRMSIWKALALWFMIGLGLITMILCCGLYGVAVVYLGKVA